MKNVMAFWLSMGCDGFRVDMAGSLVKNDPEQEGTIALWRQVFAWLEKAFPEAAMVSEWGEPDRSLREGFHMDFLLHFGPSHYNDLFRCDNAFFARKRRRFRLREGLRGYPGQGGKGPYLYSFRKPRYAAAHHPPAGGGCGWLCVPAVHARRTLPCTTATRSECGISGTCPQKEGGYFRTGARTPMQWDRTANAGFSTAAPEKLYLPMDPAEDRPTVEAQMADPDSLYQEVRHLIEVRRANPALGNLGSCVLSMPRRTPARWCICGKGEGERVLVILNPSETAGTFPWTEGLGERIHGQGGAASVENGTVTVPAKSASFYRV